MEETLTVIRLGIKGRLKRTLESTNPAESMIDTVRTTQRNVKNWSSGEMGLRWTAAGMLEAEKQFRKVIGYTQPPATRNRDRTTTPPSPAQPHHDPGGRDRSHCVTITPGPSSPKFHGDRGNLLSTLDEIGHELVSDSLVSRYDPEASPDGLQGREGTFSMCTFWYVEALARAGHLDEARLVFEKMLTYANHLGLYAEEIGPTGEQLGNFPQAFTHLALISAATNLDRQLG